MPVRRRLRSAAVYDQATILSVAIEQRIAHHSETPPCSQISAGCVSMTRNYPWATLSSLRARSVTAKPERRRSRPLYFALVC
jgi:hypothetical protein